MVDIASAFSLQARSRRNALAATHVLRRLRTDTVAAQVAVSEAAASGPPGRPQHDLRRPPPPLAQR